ncbi:antibiotic biosynthesis monooxygenase [Mariniflexile soesokkakense]|uniref:Antibiotic biosynthesis monooxygenase n=1 Tax=Mariniflexile soesokkakense TaxID=1343160 RepID=A0ABV0AB96_9FLAO
MDKTPPYYAVIFTSKHSKNTDGYDEMAEQMETLAKQQKGFLGMTSIREHIGITVSYWESLDAIANWKQQNNHLTAQEKGRNTWYDWYDVKICKVERAYSFNTPKTIA